MEEVADPREQTIGYLYARRFYRRAADGKRHVHPVPESGSIADR